MIVRKILIAVLGTLILGACTQYYYGSKAFDSEEEMLSYQKLVWEQRIAKIEPLPKPLGGPVVIVLPTISQAEALLRSNVPKRYAEYFDVPYFARTAEKSWLFYPRIIKRRNIFKDVKTVRASTPDGIETPRNGFLIWWQLWDKNIVTCTQRACVSQLSGRAAHIHILAAEETKTTQIERGHSGDDKSVDVLRRELDQIEAFVKIRGQDGNKK